MVVIVVHQVIVTLLSKLCGQLFATASLRVEVACEIQIVSAI
jgi:hypothetical protein